VVALQILGLYGHKGVKAIANLRQDTSLWFMVLLADHFLPQPC